MDRNYRAHLRCAMVCALMCWKYLIVFLEHNGGLRREFYQDLVAQTKLVSIGSMHCWVLVFSCSYVFILCPGKPTCRCPVGFSGPFCERRICDNYCLNGGTCDVTQGNQPVCRCMAEYTGERCLYRECCTHYSTQQTIIIMRLAFAWLTLAFQV